MIMDDDDGEVVVELEFHEFTDAAVAFADPEDENELIFIPQSQISNLSDLKHASPGSVVCIDIPEWLMKEKELHDAVI